MQKLVEKLGISEGAASAVLWVGLSLILLVVVALLALWLVRTLRPSLNINGGSRGGRPQRLAITDAFPLDRDGRKLVIVRRDNTEHLLLIGGPNDLLVEANITLYDRATRGLGRSATDAESDDNTLPQAPIMPAVLAPVQPPFVTPAVTPAAPRPAPAAYTPPKAPQPPAFQPPPAPQPVTPVVVAPVLPAPVLPVVEKPAVADAPPVESAPVASAPVASAPPPEATTLPELPVLTLESLLPEAVPVATTPPPAAPVASAKPEPASVARPPAMSEMARRLNEALQKPMSGTLRPPFNRSIPPAPPTTGASPPPVVAAPPPAAAPVAPPPAPEPKAVAPEPEPVPAKADMDMLEEEMARLLGRPATPKNTDTFKKPEIS